MTVPAPTPAPPVPDDVAPDLRDMDDVASTRTRSFDNIMKALQDGYPIGNERYRLELADLAYDSDKPFTKNEQKDAIMRQRTLYRRLKGTWQFVDTATGKVVDRHPTVIAHVPWLTERGTFIHGGGEYAVPGQMRLRSGVYTRRKESGELEAHFNLLPGQGKAFRVSLEPSTGVLRMHVGQGSVPLYPVLRAQGVTDERIEEAWGADIFRANKDQRDFSGAGTVGRARSGGDAEFFDENRLEVRRRREDAASAEDRRAFPMAQERPV
jgi:DNA-directed RNA polymerase beta subunit